MLLTAEEFKTRTYRFIGSLPFGDSEDGTAQIENAVRVASDVIERYLQRELNLKVHTQVMYPQAEEYRFEYERYQAFADQWPVLSVQGITKPKDGTAITDVTVEPFFERTGDEEKRYFLIEEAFQDPIKIEYLAGYKVAGETRTDAQINEAFGTEDLVFPPMPEKIVQSCVALTVYQAERLASGAIGRTNTSQFVQGQQVTGDYYSEYRFENDLLASLQAFRSLV